MSENLGAQQTWRNWLKAGQDSERDVKMDREILTESKNKGNLKAVLKLKKKTTKNFGDH